MKSWIASKSLLGEGGADTWDNLLFFPVVNPGTNKLNAGALRAVLGGRAAQAKIPDSAKESAQKKARALLEKEFKVELKNQEQLEKVQMIAYEIAEVKQEGILKRLVRKLANFIGFQTQELSDVDIREQLMSELARQATGNFYFFVRDVYDKYFVYEREEPTPDGPGVIKMYKRGYTANKDKVTLDDEAIEVEPKIEYVPVANTQKEEISMDRIEVIDGLIACEHCPFTDADRDFLTALDDERFEIFAGLKDRLVPAEDPKTLEELMASAPEAIRAEYEAKIAPPEVNTVDEYVAEAPDEIKEVLTDAVRLQKEKKAKLVTDIVKNERADYTEEELKAKPVAELERLHKLVTADYSGVAGGVRVQTEQKGVPEAPSVFE